MPRRLQWLVAIAVLIGVAWGGYQFLVRNHRLSFVPEAMDVSHILHASEESWGFGPGGNETGITVYEMPKAVAAQLETAGLKYLENLPQQSHGHWRGRYEKWLPTPLVYDDRWPGDQVARNQIDGDWTSPGIGDYMFRYGFVIPLDRDVERMVNDAIFRPGSYYAHGRIGMIILIPAARRIVYAYRG
jgi:hypothetical protein